ncbi:MAG: hypothetical protein MSIBF_01400 [Candidatus Altiarchaeales archaeon IMC4]|nr:MAG: hypothetical protein MSIBF_01400 [Candidatus Altiarchaeales archaeon IMC4]
METVTLSGNWQICLVKGVREKLGLKPRMRFIETIEDDRIVLKPIRSFTEVGASLKGLSCGKTTQDLINELKRDWEC